MNSSAKTAGVLVLLGLVAAASVLAWRELLPRLSARVEFAAGLPEGPAYDEIFRGMELALREAEGQAGPYAVKLLRGPARSGKPPILQLPGSQSWETPARDVDRWPLAEAPDAYGVPAPPAALAAALARLLERKELSELLILHPFQDDASCALRKGLKNASGARFLDFSKEGWELEIRGSAGPVVLDPHGPPQSACARVRAAGYAGPLLIEPGSLHPEFFKDAPGLLVGLARREPPPGPSTLPEAARAGYASCDFALKTLGAYPVMDPGALVWIEKDFLRFDPWRGPLGDAELRVCRDGAFRRWSPGP